MAKNRKQNPRYKKNKFKKGMSATPQHTAQRRIVRMEKNLLHFVKKDENGKIIGVEFSDDITDSITPSCPKCHSPMELKKPKAGQKWQTFWGCTMYPITRCLGVSKFIFEKKPQEENKYEAPTIESVVGNQNKINELEIVKKNKQGEYFVNKSIQAESKGSLSWNDVIDLIDEASDENEYPEIIIDQLEIFRDQILAKIQAEQGIVVARKAPKKTAQAKEPEKIHTKPTGHTYNEIQQNKEYKAQKRAARAIASQERVERQQNGKVINNPLDDKTKRNQLAQQARQNLKKPKFLVTPMSKANPRGPSCPICQGVMSKKEPKQNQTWKPFWGCVKFPKCKGTVKY